ncbi:ammonia-dependent NAD(+) synthetase [Alkalicoccobacillus porphyridii]|uniref:NH(3)-dependent NAD(+) synthetase n=1 Tax=Alkalicoccobacillus porphyridii TaxID=2597270 RepID=A0A553ZV04_9BACI|nr:ammonia-dependent NAD(+) synthetase [Alkalicoccobacillus porphyridii]TSB45155.1 ammonia-dependent NAD(+) synthetase [Alkalicoccobacillus porphyridii]
MKSKQKEIIEALQTKPVIDVAEEIQIRKQFIKDYLVQSKAKGFVLGISGGQDSTLLGRLAQLAINELNEQYPEEGYAFHAVRLPHGEQKDEADARDAVQFIEPSKTHTVNIKPAVDASASSFEKAIGEPISDFLKGNIKARERMKVQYDLGAHFGCLVLGTDHSAEAVTGFFTKFGDGACDLTPLFGLTKRQGKQLLKELGAPEHLYTKAPTADLEEDKPGVPDEEALGMTYEQIDDYLEGKEIDPSVAENLEARYDKTEHKRELPATIYDTWWKK